MTGWLAALALGCAGPTPAAGDTAAAPVDQPDAWSYEADAFDDSFDAEQVVADLQASFAMAHAVPAQPLLDAHLTALSWGDAACPPLASSGDYRQWLGVCQTEDDTRFAGGVFFYSVEDELLDGSTGFWAPADASVPGGALWTGSVWHGQAYVRGASGASFMGSGLLAELEGQSPDGRWLQVDAVSGQYLWDGEGSDEDWLGTGVFPDLLSYRFTDPDTGARGLKLAGSLSFETEAGLSSVAFDSVSLDDGMWGDPCALEPTGALRYRDPRGHWLELEFDPEVGIATPDERCDGCGRALRDGEVVGEICVDFEDLYGS